MLSADHLRRLEPDQLLRLIASQISIGLDIIASGNLIADQVKTHLEGEPLLRIGDFTIYAREDKP